MDKLMNLFPALSGRKLLVEDIDLEVSVRNALKWRGIHTVDQLLQLSHAELVQAFPNRSLRGYEDVIHCLVRLTENQEGTGAAASGFASVSNIGDVLGGAGMSDKKFNIFQVAGIWKSEEIHTSVIAELINPKSAFHDKGAVFLDEFLRMRKIGVTLLHEELENAEVKTEDATGTGRRVDMTISAGGCYLPFEVKIWARDQGAQLQEYYAFAEAQARKGVSQIYYLTPDGRSPSEQSRGGLGDKVCLLSFKAHILPWLEECMKDSDIPSDVLEIMKQLRDNIQGRPGTQGFYPWDVLDAIYQKLSQEYDLPWTECNKYYMTFTLT